MARHTGRAFVLVSIPCPPPSSLPLSFRLDILGMAFHSLCFIIQLCKGGSPGPNTVALSRARLCSVAYLHEKSVQSGLPAVAKRMALFRRSSPRIPERQFDVCTDHVNSILPLIILNYTRIYSHFLQVAHRIPLSLLGRVCLARGADAGFRACRRVTYSREFCTNMDIETLDSDSVAWQTRESMA